jgi:hypothetical protein
MRLSLFLIFLLSICLSFQIGFLFASKNVETYIISPDEIEKIRLSGIKIGVQVSLDKFYKHCLNGTLILFYDSKILYQCKKYEEKDYF